MSFILNTLVERGSYDRASRAESQGQLVFIFEICHVLCGLTMKVTVTNTDPGCTTLHLIFSGCYVNLATCLHMNKLKTVGICGFEGSNDGPRLRCTDRVCHLLLHIQQELQRRFRLSAVSHELLVARQTASRSQHDACIRRYRSLER